MASHQSPEDESSPSSNQSTSDHVLPSEAADQAPADADPRRRESDVFLHTVLGDGLGEGLWAHLWWLRDRHTRWVRAAADARGALDYRGAHDVYFGVGLMPRARGPSDRVRVDTASGLLGVVVDLDIAGPVHKKQGLPPNHEAAWTLLADISLEPTLVIDSGHGLQAWWLFTEPWRFVDADDRQRAIRLSASWQTHLHVLAAARGWTVDSVGDLARVLRVPGTLNAKDAAHIVPVRLLHSAPATRYRPDDLERYLADHAAIITTTVSEQERGGDIAGAGDETPALDDAALLQKALSNPRHGTNFLRGYVQGDTAPWNGDDSAADMAIVGELAYWCGPDPARIDRLFRRSQLYRNPGRATKWIAKHYANGETYGQHLIATVLKGRTRFAQQIEWEEPVPLPDELPAVAPLDPALLPTPLRAWLEDCARRIGAPLDFFGAPAMALAGSLIGRQVGIHPKRYDDWLVVANLWGALVGLPSTMKTPALREVMKALSELLAKADERYRADTLAYDVALAQHEAQITAIKDLLKQSEKTAANPATQPPARADAQRAIDSLKQQLAMVKSAAPRPPVKRRYKTEDATVEKLAELLVDNPQGLLLHRDELMGWLRVLDDPAHGKDRAFYLEAWEGLQGHEIDRIGRGSLWVPAVCMAVLGGIQPGPLSAYVHAAMGTDEGNDGFLQRFQVLVWPDPAPMLGEDSEPDVAARARAYAVFHALPTLAENVLHLIPPVAGGSSSADTIPTLRFDVEGQATFDRWNAAQYTRLTQHDLHPAFEAHLIKYRSLMPSLALIYQIVTEVGAARPLVAVGRDAAEAAVRWCAYLETHARRLYGATIAPDVDGARALLRHIQAGDVHDGDTIRRLYLKHWRNADTPDKAHAALRVLEEYGWARVEKVSGTGGAPAHVIRINPQALINLPAANREGAEEGEEGRA